MAKRDKITPLSEIIVESLLTEETRLISNVNEILTNPKFRSAIESGTDSFYYLGFTKEDLAMISNVPSANYINILYTTLPLLKEYQKLLLKLVKQVKVSPKEVIFTDSIIVKYHPNREQILQHLLSSLDSLKLSIGTSLILQLGLTGEALGFSEKELPSDIREFIEEIKGILEDKLNLNKS